MECGNKTRFSEAMAWRRAKRLRKRGEIIHAYHCKRCGFWHIGRDDNESRRFANGELT